MSTTPVPDNTICVRYEQNFDDWHEALVTVGVLPRRPYLSFLLWAVASAMLAIITRNDKTLLAPVLLSFVTVMLLAIALKANDITRKRLRDNWHASRISNLPIDIRFCPDIVTIDTQLTHTKMQWPVFIGFRETTRLFIIIVGTGNILTLPKSLMPESDQSALRKLLTEKIIPGGVDRVKGFAVMTDEAKEHS